MFPALMGVLLMLLADLPVGNAPTPVVLPHFPDRVHAFVWRNWSLVPKERLATVLGTEPKEVQRMGEAMGLPSKPVITPDQQRRSYLTVIRRNWHLLPYEQLLQLLNWTPEEMAFTLREDDFLYIKLGSHKPKCEPLRYQPPDAKTLQREKEIKALIQREFPATAGPTEPLFAFVQELSRPKRSQPKPKPTEAQRVTPRYCYSYFALYGDPLLEKEADPYPDGFLARLAEAGVDGVWLQAVLYKLAPFPWEPQLSARYEERLVSLKKLVARAKKHGIGVYLYLNEPRAMPLSFFTAHPDLKGATEGDHATICTSHPDVQRYLKDSIGSISRAVPDLAGFFTISASENLTNCWSHGGGKACPRCSKRTAAEVIAELHTLINDGIKQGGSKARLIAWDWGWGDDWAADVIRRLPTDVSLMSVSEWSLPIERGGIKSEVGEYSISSVGPGPRAKRHWAVAKERGIRILAKVQSGNTWELSAVPYIPAVENVAQHAANLQKEQLNGVMLGWTLGGYPSPNLEIMAGMGLPENATPQQAMETVAQRRYGKAATPAVVEAWRTFSAAFREFPYHIGLVYTAPMQLGPANLFWEEPTKYGATMVGFPYDDLDSWRAIYPPEIYIAQMNKVADGFEKGLVPLKAQIEKTTKTTERNALEREAQVAEAAYLHFRSVANQGRFVVARRALTQAKTRNEAEPLLTELETVLKNEIELARRLYVLQLRDSRIGFEASNQYYYVPTDLMEKVLNATDLLQRWLPEERKRRP